MTVKRIPVGDTPKKRYANWAEHRDAMARDALAVREMRRQAHRKPSAERSVA